MNLLNEQAIQGSGVSEFTDHDHNSDSVRQAVANTPPSSSSTLVSFGRGLPSLSKKLVDQIRGNQYVDFSDLPLTWGKTRTPHQSATGEGQIVLVQAADLADTKKIIRDLAVWLQCFALYVAVLTPPPDCLQDLMAYQSFIAKCSLKYRWPSWVVYDENFRLEVATRSFMGPV